MPPICYHLFPETFLAAAMIKFTFMFISTVLILYSLQQWLYWLTFTYVFLMLDICINLLKEDNISWLFLLPLYIFDFFLLEQCDYNGNYLMNPYFKRHSPKIKIKGGGHANKRCMNHSLIFLRSSQGKFKTRRRWKARKNTGFGKMVIFHSVQSWQNMA